jgi:hypothetical protein
MERNSGQTLALNHAPPCTTYSMGLEHLTVNVGEHKRIGFNLAGSRDESELQSVELVSPEHRDGGRGEGDSPPSTIRLGRFKA